MNVLILYYSHSGNTKKLAEYIQKATGADIIAITPIIPYPNDFNLLEDKGKQEVDLGLKPSIKPFSIKVNEYDTVFIGTPVWRKTVSSPMRTALSTINWKNKKVYPFATHNGLLGHALEDLKDMLTIGGATVQRGFDATVPFVSEKQIECWIKEVGLWSEKSMEKMVK